ncbi:hypothetical protein X798_02147 [Onchocerca flexuosa]|uniref:Uncharacterized protein n=1 Tax=Onchocerca flexuosa TaxID=387005 RepID=A0A238C0T0_9BILA|nr:hypothetical protein X798_02147 [Onchocerca flexuosa]
MQMAEEIAAVTDKGYAEIEKGDELGLKQAMAKYGSVVVGINGSKLPLKFYTSENIYLSKKLRNS